MEWESQDVGVGPIVNLRGQKYDTVAPLMVSNYSATDGYAAYGLSPDGRLISVEATAGRPFFGDVFGGLVSITSRPNSQSNVGDGMVRTSATSELISWRYESIGGFIDPPVQAKDGFIYTLEYVPGVTSNGQPITDAAVAIINGATGALVS